MHGALLLICIGIGCRRMALAACTQMAADMTGLLQWMLPRLDATHLTVCIAVSKLFETQPENRNHGQAFGCCQTCLPCMPDLVLARLQTKQQSLSATFLIKIHNRCISKTFQRFVQILSGARNFATRMHWGRMLYNGFGRLHSNGYAHNWAVATDVTKIRCYSPGGMHCSL